MLETVPEATDIPSNRLEYPGYYLVAAHVFYSALKRSLKDHVLTPTDFRILLRLLTHVEPLSPSQLSEMMTLNSSNVALSLMNLEKYDAIKRTKDSLDKRKQTVSFTEKGYEYAQELRAIIKPLIDRFHNELPQYMVSYVYLCTKGAGEYNGLFPNDCLFRKADIALFDEMFHTINIASQICRKHDLTVVNYQTLTQLKNNLPGMTPGDLAHVLQTRPNNVTVVSKQLLNSGMIQRHHSPIDQRSSILEITSYGWHAWSSANEELSKFLLTGMIAYMSDEDIERHKLISDTIVNSGIY